MSAFDAWVGPRKLPLVGERWSLPQIERELRAAFEAGGTDTAQAFCDVMERFAGLNEDLIRRISRASGHPWADEWERPQHADLAQCAVCGGTIEFYDSPSGSWWSHIIHPSDDHDAKFGTSVPDLWQMPGVTGTLDRHG